MQYNDLKEDTDTEVDDFQRRMGEQDDDFVLESRLGYKFVSGSFDIYFDCDLDVAAERIFKDQRSSETEMGSIGDAKAAIRSRVEGDKRRYRGKYGIDYPEIDKFDLVVDTSDRDIDEVLDIVLAAVRNYQAE